MPKKNVAVLFGGRSSEHDVSKISVTTILDALSTDLYHVIPVYITKEGRWYMYEGPIENIRQVQWEKFGTPVVLSPDAGHHGLIRLVGDKARVLPVDVVFPVLHGLNGEDGTIQGLCELAGIPYVGCRVLASSLAMDKAFTKIIAEKMGIPQTKHLVMMRHDLSNSKLKETFMKDVRYKIGYPCFVKPANAGSSVGVSKAHNKKDLEKALILASEHDRTIIVEKAIVGREVECAVLGNEELTVSVVGEVCAAADFYDYEAKYHNSESKTIIPADISPETTAQIQQYAATIFKAIGGSGLARVDFFVEKDTNLVIFNEINTFPGFTPISMYPILINHSGINNKKLVDTLIDLAFKNAEKFDSNKQN